MESMHHGKRNTLFCEEKRFFICIDVDKYKYSPGDHKIVATLRSPGHFLLLPFVEMAVLANDFPLVEGREGLPEGKGLFSKIDIPSSIIWMMAGIFVIYMSSVMSRMEKTQPNSLITARDSILG